MTNAEDGRTVAELILLDGRSLNREGKSVSGGNRCQGEIGVSSF